MTYGITFGDPVKLTRDGAIKVVTSYALIDKLLKSGWTKVQEKKVTKKTTKKEEKK